MVKGPGRAHSSHLSRAVQTHAVLVHTFSAFRRQGEQQRENRERAELRKKYQNHRKVNGAVSLRSLAAAKIRSRLTECVRCEQFRADSKGRLFDGGKGVIPKRCDRVAGWLERQKERQRRRNGEKETGGERKSTVECLLL